MRRRRRKADHQGQEASISEEEESVTLPDQRNQSITKKARECPVPKPMGIIGILLRSGKGEEEATIAPKVRVETRKAERRTDEAE